MSEVTWSFKMFCVWLFRKFPSPGSLACCRKIQKMEYENLQLGMPAKKDRNVIVCKYQLLSHRFQLHRANDMTLTTTARLKISSSVPCLWCTSVNTLIQSISTVCGYIFFLQVKKKLHSFFSYVFPINFFYVEISLLFLICIQRFLPVPFLLLTGKESTTLTQFKELNLLRYIFIISFSSLFSVLCCFILDNNTGYFRKKLCTKCYQ